MTGPVDVSDRPKHEVELKTGIRPPSWFNPQVTVAQLGQLPARRPRRGVVS